MLQFWHENLGYGRSLSPNVPLLAQYPEGMHVGAAGNIASGVFTPVPAKHSESFSLIDCISVGVDYGPQLSRISGR